jgi:hypothetical protein
VGRRLVSCAESYGVDVSVLKSLAESKIRRC